MAARLLTLRLRSHFGKMRCARWRTGSQTLSPLPFLLSPLHFFFESHIPRVES